MGIGERICFSAQMRNDTKQLDMLLGFSKYSSDVHMAQYKIGSRTPKAELMSTLDDTFGVSPQATYRPGY